MKYRILKDKNGLHKIQFKTQFFSWSFWKDYTGDRWLYADECRPTHYFKTMEDAMRFVKELEKNQNNGWSQVWPDAKLEEG